MTLAILMSDVIRDFLNDSLGEMPPSVRVDCQQDEGFYRVRIFAGERVVWAVSAMERDAVLDVLSDEYLYVGQMIREHLNQRSIA